MNAKTEQPMVDFATARHRNKVETALEALRMTTPGDWWVDSRGDMHNDAVGNFRIARDVGGNTALWKDANRAVLSAARELAMEVLALRKALDYDAKLRPLADMVPPSLAPVPTERGAAHG